MAEATAKDVGRGIVRFDPGDFEKLNVQVGDVVTVEGKRQTVAKVLPAYMEDRGKGLIRLDGITRENARVGIDEKVKITVCDFQPARKIVVAPLTPCGRMMPGISEACWKGFPWWKGTWCGHA